MSELGDNRGSFGSDVVLCMDPEALDRFGGVLRHLTVGLVDQAVPLRLLSCDRRVETLKLGPVHVHVHKPIHFRWPLARRRLELILESLTPQPPDLVHAVSGASYRLAELVARTLDAELVCQVTSRSDVGEVARMPGDRIGRLIAMSQPLATLLTENRKWEPRRVELIRPGVWTAANAACFSEPDRTPTLLSLCRWERGSGVDRLMEAARLLRERDRDFMLFLLGKGSREFALRRLIHQQNLSTYVTLAQPEGDLTELFRSADILVQPSVRRAFSEDTLEAMGAGLTVVTADDEISDYIRPEETAIVCEKPTGAVLADAIDGLLSDPEKARGIARAGIEYVRTHHGMSAMATRTAEVYRNLTLKRATFSIQE